MSLLSRYLMRQNAFLLFSILVAGTGLYLLTDLFERLDNLLEGSAGIGIILTYFAVKLPSIVAQILPAVFLLSFVLQFNFLERSRELIAMEAGGISPVVLVRFILLYGFVWTLAQFMFGQVLGVAGEKLAARVWQEEIQGRTAEDVALKGLWFTEKDMIVHVGEAFPTLGRGENILVYVLGSNRTDITEIIKAKTFVTESGFWKLDKGEHLIPEKFSATPFEELRIALTQDLKDFQVGEKSAIRPGQLTLFELGETIARLQAAGSNVEQLLTAWHGKLSYAASIMVMGLLGLAVARTTSNIYKAIVLAILFVFFYYSLNVFCSSMGGRGILSPFVGSWSANIFFFCFAAAWLAWPVLRRKFGS